MTRFCLVRHGQTDWNLAGRYQGQNDTPLNAAGLDQARRLAEGLKGCAFTAVYSSDLQRAHQTAFILAEALGLPVIPDRRLREIHQGEWEGQLIETIKTRYNDLWQQRLSDPTRMRPPGGESVGEVAQRVCVALDEIAAHHPQAQVLVVTHGLSLSTAVCRAYGYPLRQAYDHIPDNAAPVWLEW